ncbi:hypothetical protein Ciccas_014421, partial [Cichlidogyrus casuarinus]
MEDDDVEEKHQLSEYLLLAPPKGNELEQLAAYQPLLDLSIKLNTNLPSSASAERIFSKAGLLLGKN